MHGHREPLRRCTSVFCMTQLRFDTEPEMSAWLANKGKSLSAREREEVLQHVFQTVDTLQRLARR